MTTRYLPRHRNLAAVLAIIVLGHPVVAQDEKKTCDELLLDAASKIDEARQASNVSVIDGQWEIVTSDPRILSRCFLPDLLDRTTAKARAAAENNRIDKQIGASSASSGSTSAVPSAAVPRLLGLAFESGALTRGISGETITYRMNPAHFIATLARKYGATAPNDGAYRALNRINVSATFDQSRMTPNGTERSADGSREGVAEATLRMAIWNPRDLYGKAAQRRITDLQEREVSRAASVSAQKLQVLLAFAPGYKEEFEYYRLQMVGVRENGEGTLAILQRWYSKVLPSLKIAGLGASIEAAEAAREVFEQDARKVYEGIAAAPTIHFEYAFVRIPVLTTDPESSSLNPPRTTSGPTPDVHVARLIGAGALIGKSTYTWTASAGFFSQDRPEMRGRFRDWQVGGKIDMPIANFMEGKGALSFNGLIMNLHQKPFGIDLLAFNNKKVNVPGLLGLFQAKYSIPLGDSGVSIPLSITWSSRTELIDEPEVRGNFGLTFDLDKLFAKTAK